MGSFGKDHCCLIYLWYPKKYSFPSLIEMLNYPDNLECEPLTEIKHQEWRLENVRLIPTKPRSIIRHLLDYCSIASPQLKFRSKLVLKYLLPIDIRKSLLFPAITWKTPKIKEISTFRVYYLLLLRYSDERCRVNAAPSPPTRQGGGHS